MPFPARLETQGGSHLFVTLAGKCVSFLIVDSDVSGERPALYCRNFTIGSRVTPDNLDYFLAKALKVWSKEIDWDLVSCDDELCMLALSEGDTVDGVTLIVDRAFSKEPFHSMVLGVDAVVFDERMSVDAAANYLDVLEASAIINVVANWDGVRVYVTTGGEVARKGGGILVREMAIEQDMLEHIPEKTMPSLLGVSLRKDELIDLVANIRAQKVTEISSNAASDALRAFLTAALFNMRDQTLQVFGHDSPDPFLLISGEIARALPVSYLILSVIDGLQLRGRYTIGIDKNYASLPAAIVKAKRTVPIPVNSIYPLRYMYVSTEKGASGKDGQTSFRGRLVEIGVEDEMGEMIVGQTGDIVTYATENPGKVLLQPARSVYFPNLIREKMGEEQYLVAEFSKRDAGVIIDCRKIPAVYGPDAQANMSRIRNWIQGLPEESSKY